VNLAGADFRDCVTERQKVERQERQLEREAQKSQMEQEKPQRENDVRTTLRIHEYEMFKLQLDVNEYKTYHNNQDW